MLISLRAAVRRWAAAARSDRGSMAVEVVVLFPLLFGLMFLGVQGALIYQGRAVALAAAQEGARTAAAYGASIGDGLRQARAFADTSSANLRDIDVSGRRSAFAGVAQCVPSDFAQLFLGEAEAFVGAHVGVLRGGKL